MGILDFPAPVFSLIDGIMAAELGPLARLTLWALLISAISLALYVLLSPQAKLRELKGDIRTARRELSTHDGDFATMRSLAARNIGLSLKQVSLVAPAALAACIPVIMLLVWLGKSYGTVGTESGLPLAMDMSGGRAELRISEIATEARGGPAGADPLRLQVLDPKGHEVLEAPLTPALTRLEKRRWWHWLSGNAYGYLPDEAPVDAIHVRWPRREVVSVGPDWLRGWELPFLSIAVVLTLGMQMAFRIE